jgi:hypothetical protein
MWLRAITDRAINPHLEHVCTRTVPRAARLVGTGSDFGHMLRLSAGEVVICVLNSSDKEVGVRLLVKEKYCSQRSSDKFSYRSKAKSS